MNFLAEVKDGEKQPSKRKLTPEQAEWHEAWMGQIIVIETIDDVVAFMGRVLKLSRLMQAAIVGGRVDVH